MKIEKYIDGRNSYKMSRTPKNKLLVQHINNIDVGPKPKKSMQIQSIHKMVIEPVYTLEDQIKYIEKNYFKSSIQNKKQSIITLFYQGVKLRQVVALVNPLQNLCKKNPKIIVKVGEDLFSFNILREPLEIKYAQENPLFIPSMPKQTLKIESRHQLFIPTKKKPLLKIELANQVFIPQEPKTELEIEKFTHIFISELRNEPFFIESQSIMILSQPKKYKEKQVISFSIEPSFDMILINPSNGNVLRFPRRTFDNIRNEEWDEIKSKFYSINNPKSQNIILKSNFNSEDISIQKICRISYKNNRHLAFNNLKVEYGDMIGFIGNS